MEGLGRTSCHVHVPYTYPYNLSTHLSEKKRFGKARNIPANQWSVDWRVRLNMYDVGSLIAVDCGATGGLLKKLSIPHKDAGQKVCSGRPMGAEDVVGTTTGHLCTLKSVDGSR